jgi:hypothetical protein
MGALNGLKISSLIFDKNFKLTAPEEDDKDTRQRLNKFYASSPNYALLVQGPSTSTTTARMMAGFKALPVCKDFTASFLKLLFWLSQAEL